MKRKRQKDKQKQKVNESSAPCTCTSEKKKSVATRSNTKKQDEIRARDRQRKREKRQSMTKEEIDDENRKRRQRRLESKLELETLKQLKKEMAQKRKELDEQKKQLEERERRLEEDVRRRVDTEAQKALHHERTKAAKRKSLSRAFHGLPKSPTKFANTVADVLNKASPKKKSALEVRGLGGKQRELHQAVSSSMAEYLRSVKRSRKKNDLSKKQHLIQSMPNWKEYKLQRKACKHFGLTSSTIKKAKNTVRKMNKRAVTNKTKQDVIKFYEDCAVQLSDKKLISKKSLKKTGFLQRPITLLFDQFKEKYPTTKIGLKKFFSLRPKHIKPVGAIKYRGCLCEYCCNAELKLAALNKIAHCYKQQSLFQGVYGVSQLTMCPKENGHRYNKRVCIERKCKDCGTVKLDSHVENLLQLHQNKPISWRKWESTTSQVKGKEVAKQELVNKSGTMADCLQELQREVQSLSLHLFNASWQSQQFSNISGNVPNGWVVMVQDFAENFVCTAQDEIQSAHWNHSTATIHPNVCYYKCPKCHSIMEESLIFITPDKKHDYHAVHEFMTTSVQYLKTRLCPTEIQHIVRFSDGAACQYKSKGPFLDVAMAEKEYGVPVTYHYFGSRHGKGPSDGESAVVKRQASQAVLAGTFIINDAKDLYEFTKQISKRPVGDECLHFQRTVFFVDEINRDRGHERVDLKTLKGTRKLHCIRGQSSGAVSTRNLSCFCEPCVTCAGYCLNKDYVDGAKDCVIFTIPPKITQDGKCIFYCLY